MCGLDSVVRLFGCFFDGCIAGSARSRGSRRELKVCKSTFCTRCIPVLLRGFCGWIRAAQSCIVAAGSVLNSTQSQSNPKTAAKGAIVEKAATVASGGSDDSASSARANAASPQGKGSRGDDPEPEVLSSDEELREENPRKPTSSASKSAPAVTPRGAPQVFSALLRMVRAAQSIIVAIVAAGTAPNSTQRPSNTEAAAEGATAKKAAPSADGVPSGSPHEITSCTPVLLRAFLRMVSCGAEQHSGCRFYPESYSELVEYRGRCQGRYCHKGCDFGRARCERRLGRFRIAGPCERTRCFSSSNRLGRRCRWPWPERSGGGVPR